MKWLVWKARAKEKEGRQSLILPTHPSGKRSLSIHYNQTHKVMTFNKNGGKKYDKFGNNNNTYFIIIDSWALKINAW